MGLLLYGMIGHSYDSSFPACIFWLFKRKVRCKVTTSFMICNKVEI